MYVYRIRLTGSSDNAVCICIYVCTYVRTYVCMYMYLYMHVYAEMDACNWNQQVSLQSASFIAISKFHWNQ